MTTIHFVVIILLILLAIIAAFLSGSETALTGTSDARVYILIKQKVKNSNILKDLRSNFSAISTILIGNQVINSAISTVVTWLIIDIFGEAKLPVIALISTLVFITYTEILPKMIAVTSPEQFLLSKVKFLKNMVYLLHPFVSLLEYIADQTLKLFHVEHKRNMSKDISTEEVRGVIDIHTSKINAKHEKIMLNGILDMNELEISQIITPRNKIFQLNSSLPLDKINDELLQNRYTRVPIWTQTPENIVGILHSKAFFQHYSRNKKFDILTICSKPWFIPETTKVIKQLQEFKTRREHFSIAVDEYGAITGIVTLEDVLEEIVGEILDEYDVKNNAITIQEDSSIIADATVAIRDLNRECDLNIPEETEASTIGGFIIYNERRIPKKNEIVKISDEISAEILKRKRNMIVSVRLYKNQSKT